MTKKRSESLRELLFQKYLECAKELGFADFGRQDVLLHTTEELAIILLKGEMRAVIAGAMQRRGAVLPYHLVEEVDRASTRWTEASDLH